ncbi:beta-ketoacyl-ACP reductase [Pontibacter sp. G13]|uniref:beta-ketoacyl-ACP reductase n=1 Tax=Pontibacter sp. G13 TaxID=3074898 RepID=UPI00288AAA46|nr:beta-ketoacyl-ACP reductase [Pontibacter sp. G13]WNJ18759.1 beta-ketoacyl-ACP reductase [Pontibacter sp. G13]
MGQRLANQTAIITGGARGIGKATAHLFAQEGANIIIWDMLDEGQETAKEVSGSFQQVNVADPQSVQVALDIAIKQHEQVDILINNAGITRDRTLMKMSFEEWKQVLDVNLTGVFNCTKAVAPCMVEKKYGRIVSTSSIVGIHGNYGQTNYTATKGGIIAMTKTWAKELGKYGITANAVAPGFIQTDMTDLIPKEVRDRIIGGIPAGRMGIPDDIAHAYLYLASPEAGYVNGHTLRVTGGAG